MGWIHTSFCMGEGFADAITFFFSELDLSR